MLSSIQGEVAWTESSWPQSPPFITFLGTHGHKMYAPIILFSLEYQGLPSRSHTPYYIHIWKITWNTSNFSAHFLQVSSDISLLRHSLIAYTRRVGISLPLAFGSTVGTQGPPFHILLLFLCISLYVPPPPPHTHTHTHTHTHIRLWFAWSKIWVLFLFASHHWAQRLAHIRPG
jgi:hypothetical protein